MAVLNWQCPYCGHHSVLGGGSYSTLTFLLNGLSKRGDSFGLKTTSVSCLNAECQELSVEVSLGRATKNTSNARGVYYTLDSPNVQLSRRLLPAAKVMNLPKEVPEEIKITYQEAAEVAEISGRAGAAMARRCLQGIVRDFFDIPQDRRGNLGAELAYVKDKIDPLLWTDIQNLRAVGDIGAHMDNNVNEIIDVTPDEARLLIRLIETLFQDWYINRARRLRDSLALTDLLKEKRGAQKAAKTASRKPMQGTD
ncbi:MAG: hypothetical protein CTR54_06630 [Rhizobium sp.]|nr:MAG: hypothetical protein CTR54_06630 [Rhizobium sp.]